MDVPDEIEKKGNAILTGGNQASEMEILTARAASSPEKTVVSVKGKVLASSGLTGDTKSIRLHKDRGTIQNAEFHSYIRFRHYNSNV